MITGFDDSSRGTVGRAQKLILEGWLFGVGPHELGRLNRHVQFAATDFHGLTRSCFRDLVQNVRADELLGVGHGDVDRVPEGFLRDLALLDVFVPELFRVDLFRIGHVIAVAVFAHLDFVHRVEVFPLGENLELVVDLGFLTVGRVLGFAGDFLQPFVFGYLRDKTSLRTGGVLFAGRLNISFGLLGNGFELADWHGALRVTVGVDGILSLRR